MQKLKEAIKESGVFQRHIADEAGMDVSRLSRIVCGRTDPRLSEVLKIANVLGRSLDDLFRDDSLS